MDAKLLQYHTRRATSQALRHIMTRWDVQCPCASCNSNKCCSALSMFARLWLFGVDHHLLARATPSEHWKER